MKKRLVSIILTVFLVLSMMPFAAFADNAIVCPACGGSVTKQERRLLAAHSDFYKCSKCGKWAYLNAPGGLKLFSVGDQQILDAADANAILNFAFNNGHLVPAEKAPSGIGRKDLPGYADDNGTSSVNSDGNLTFVAKYRFSDDRYHFVDSFSITDTDQDANKIWNFGSSSIQIESYSQKVSDVYAYGGYVLDTQNISGIFYIPKGTTFVYNPWGDYNYHDIGFGWKSFETDSLWSHSCDGSKQYLILYRYNDSTKKPDYMYSNENGTDILFYQDSHLRCRYIAGVSSGYPDDLVVYCRPTSVTVNKQTTITINNNTWNGNIYTDNSTNLTYIYPQYTTINEKNETVTNISNTPIIYNNETKQYYTYDQTTKNYYYITYNAPSPSPTPAPTWTPGGGATRGGGVGRHPSDTDAADWTLHYYVLNNRRYDAYYALKKTEVDTETKLPWVDNKKYISTTQIPIANGQYTVSVPDGVYWRVWSWDEASQTLTGVNSSNWHSTINNFLFNATGEYIFEFCKADGSDFDTAKDVTLKLKNDTITKYEDGGTIVEEPTPSPSPEPTETPSPTEPPTHTATPNPGGGTVPTPGGDSGGGNSGSSDSGWNPFKWLTDLLKDIVETILKGLWKLLTSIFGFILWLLSLLFKLFPWMPNSGILALCAGVVVVTVIRIIKFITGR